MNECRHTLPAPDVTRAESQAVTACSTCGRLFVCSPTAQDGTDNPTYEWVTLGWLEDLRRHALRPAPLGADVPWTPYSREPDNGWFDPMCANVADATGLCPGWHRCALYGCTYGVSIARSVPASQVIDAEMGADSPATAETHTAPEEDA